jgi:hypothetical protein
MTLNPTPPLASRASSRIRVSLSKPALKSAAPRERHVLRAHHRPTDTDAATAAVTSRLGVGVDR